MSDHEFEKQVRQKLDDLRLTPSASAWEHIEQEIRGTKRRRAPLVWLPLLLIGLGAGGYFAFKQLWAEGEKTIVERQQARGGESESGLEIKKSEESRIQKEDPEKQLPDSRLTLGQKPRTARSGPGESRAENPKSKDVRVAVDHKEEVAASNSPNIDLPNSTLAGEEGRRNEYTPLKENLPAGVEPGNEIATSQAAIEGNMRRSAPKVGAIRPSFDNTLFGTSPPSARNELSGSSTSTPTAASPLIRHRKKWSFGISAFAGASGLNNGNLLNLEKALTTVMQRPPTVAFAPSYIPYKIVAGPSYSAGLTVKREVSGRFQATASLNYLQVNTKFKLGNQVYGSQVVNAVPFDQFVRDFYTLDQHKPADYKNTYNFIELPLTLHTRLNKNQALPIYWNTGLSYARLINSNSKQFDGSTGVYSSNQKYVNKDQLALTTGFDFVLFAKRKHPVWIGPLARYNVTSLLSTDVSENKNLFSAGINSKIFLR